MPSKRVAVILKPNFIGDAVMTAPAIDSLRGAGYEIGVYCGPTVREVLFDRADGVQFEVDDWAGSTGSLLRFARSLRRGRFDAALVVNHSFRSALAAWLARIPNRVGHDTEGRSFLLTRKVAYDQECFEARSFLDLADALGGSAVPVEPHLSVTFSESERGEELRGNATVGIQLGASTLGKVAPSRIWAEVASRLVAEGHKIAILGGPNDRPLADEFLSLFQGEAVDLVGRCSIRESMAVISGLQLLAGNDTGFLHVAAALGRPTVTVFRPRMARKWRHAGETHPCVIVSSGNLSDAEPDAIVEAAKKALAGCAPIPSARPRRGR